MEINAYQKAFRFENFIRSSLQNPESARNQKAIRSYCVLYFLIEEGKNLKAHKQFIELKQYLMKALAKCSGTKLLGSKKVELRDLMFDVDVAVYLSQIDSVIEKALDILASAMK